MQYIIIIIVIYAFGFYFSYCFSLHLWYVPCRFVSCISMAHRNVTVERYPFYLTFHFVLNIIKNIAWSIQFVRNSRKIFIINTVLLCWNNCIPLSGTFSSLFFFSLISYIYAHMYLVISMEMFISGRSIHFFFLFCSARFRQENDFALAYESLIVYWYKEKDEE